MVPLCGIFIVRVGIPSPALLGRGYEANSLLLPGFRNEAVTSYTEGMMKKVVTVIGFVFLLASFWSVPASAGETKYRFDQINQKSRALVFKNLWAGYKTFQNNCKTCHSRTNDQNAPFLHTESKNMRAWNRVFLEKYPTCAEQGLWSALSQEQLVQLNDYLYANARNTYNPYDANSCG